MLRYIVDHGDTSLEAFQSATGKSGVSKEEVQEIERHKYDVYTQFRKVYHKLEAEESKAREAQSQDVIEMDWE